MIKLFKSESELGYALFNHDSGKFIYGELCSESRVMNVVSKFPNYRVEIIIERNSQDDLKSLFYLMPHLEEISTITTMKKVNPRNLLASASRVKKKRNYTITKIALGIIIGTIILSPTTKEYNSTVLTQAKNVETIAEEFVETKPDWNAQSRLYSAIDAMHKTVTVESVKYGASEYKIVFSSANKEIKLADLAHFDKATLTRVSKLKDSNGVVLYIYELEGKI